MENGLTWIGLLSYTFSHRETSPKWYSESLETYRRFSHPEPGNVVGKVREHRMPRTAVQQERERPPPFRGCQEFHRLPDLGISDAELLG